MSPSPNADLFRSIKELDHCLALLDGRPKGKDEFYLNPPAALIEYCRAIVKLAKLSPEWPGDIQ